jgi:hypothetical protein
MLEDVPPQERALTMDLSQMRRLLLLVWIAACAGTTSCKLVDSWAPGDETHVYDPGIQTEKGGKKMLSKQEILKAANRAARRRGYNLAKYDIFYDEENAGWRYLVRRLSPPELRNGFHVWPEREGAFEANLRSRWPELESHDYQAVYYVFRPSPGDKGIYGRTWILIDRNTGEVLLVFEEAG